MIEQVIENPTTKDEDFVNRFEYYRAQLKPRIAILKKDILDDIIGNESEMQLGTFRSKLMQEDFLMDSSRIRQRLEEVHYVEPQKTDVSAAFANLRKT